MDDREYEEESVADVDCDSVLGVKVRELRNRSVKVSVSEALCRTEAVRLRVRLLRVRVSISETVGVAGRVKLGGVMVKDAVGTTVSVRVGLWESDGDPRTVLSDIGTVIEGVWLLVLLSVMVGDPVDVFVKGAVTLELGSHVNETVDELVGCWVKVALGAVVGLMVEVLVCGNVSVELAVSDGETDGVFVGINDCDSVTLVAEGLLVRVGINVELGLAVRVGINDVVFVLGVELGLKVRVGISDLVFVRRCVDVGVMVVGDALRVRIGVRVGELEEEGEFV